LHPRASSVQSGSARCRRRGRRTCRWRSRRAKAWLSSPLSVVERLDAVTGPFAYLRLLGDRAAVDALTPTLDHIVIDRGEQVAADAEAIKLLAKRVPVVAFVNNHFAVVAVVPGTESVQNPWKSCQPSYCVESATHKIAGSSVVSRLLTRWKSLVRIQ